MGLFIGLEDVEFPVSHCGFEYTVHACALGLAPGFFPKEFETDIGNKKNFVRVTVNEQKAMYIQLAGCISLVVLND
jgi:hypothetical protein